MELIIIRHAKAQDALKAVIKGIPDEERALTKKGIIKFSLHIKKYSKLLRDADVYMSSPLLRSVQTLDLVAKLIGFNSDKRVQFKYIKPEDNPKQLVSWMATQKFKKVVIISHEPFMSNFIKIFDPKAMLSEKIKKGGILHIANGQTKLINPVKSKLEHVLGVKKTPIKSKKKTTKTK